MPVTWMFIILIALAAAGYLMTRRKAVASVANIHQLNSLPGHYGWFAAMMVFIPAGLFILGWVFFGDSIVDSFVLSKAAGTTPLDTDSAVQLFLNDVHNLVAGDTFGTGETSGAVKDAAAYHIYLQDLGRMAVAVFSFLLATGGAFFAYRKINPRFQARNKIEKIVVTVLVLCSLVAILTTVGIVLSLLFESLMFFAKVSPIEFLFGTDWSPQTALRADQVGSTGAFGAIPLFTGTFLISAIAMIVAVPIGLMSAIYMTQYAHRRTRKIAKPLLEILAGIPTVVFGFFAALTVAPFLREMGVTLGLDIASESALAAGLVMGVMIIPLMSSLSDDAISAVPQAMSDGSLALGATKSETIKKVLIPAALPGIMGSFLLAASRAVGETMIVVMAAGLAANLTFNPLDAVTTVTAQIVALLTGDQEFDSAKTLSAFALGLVLFFLTFLLNVVALRVVRKYREAYE